MSSSFDKWCEYSDKMRVNEGNVGSGVRNESRVERADREKDEGKSAIALVGGKT